MVLGYAYLDSIRAGVAWVSVPRVIERGLLEGGALKNTFQILLRECCPLLEALAEDVLPSPKSCRLPPRVLWS